MLICPEIITAAVAGVEQRNLTAAKPVPSTTWIGPESDTPRGAGGLMSWAASKAVGGFI
jgi:hypothetical protein